MSEKKKDNEVAKKCAGTGKALKRVKRYYRNGLYYANKTAYQAKVKKDKEAAAGAEA